MAKEVKTGKKTEKNKIKKIFLSVAIAVLFVMFVAYAIEAFYPSPKYETFCIFDKVNLNESECLENNGTWLNIDDKIPLDYQTADIPSGYCDLYSKCSEQYDFVREIYNRNLFFITLIIGVIVFIIAFFEKIEPVSSGFMSGAVILIVYGTIRYWGSLSNIWRTLMLGIALAVLVWIGYRKLR